MQVLKISREIARLITQYRAGPLLRRALQDLECTPGANFRGCLNHETVFGVTEEDTREKLRHFVRSPLLVGNHRQMSITSL